MRSLIVGTGSYSPEKVLTNADLEKMVATSDEWIVERTGIRERHIIGDAQATSDMCVIAAERALEMAGLAASDVELLIVGTITPDMPWPSTAALVQGRLGNKKAFAFDVSAACAGSLYALSIADRYVSAGLVKNALVIGGETLSRIVDWSDRNTAVLFGDGAGAMVLRPTADERRGVQSVNLHTDGSLWPILHLPAGGSRKPITAEVLAAGEQHLKMNGREVYKVAVRALVESSQQALAANRLSSADVQHVIAHQANRRILEATLDRLKIPAEKCWINLEKYGNTSSASVPTTLDEANRAGRLQEGDVILLMAIGAGMAWGAGILRW